MLGNDDHVVALTRMRAIKGGTLVTVEVISVFHYRNGKQQERWFHPTDAVSRHWLPSSSASGCSSRPTLYCATQFEDGATLARADHESSGAS